MEIYNFYRSYGAVLAMYGQDTLENRISGLTFGIAFWGILFILFSIGLYRMAANRNMPKKWMCFVPFSNVYYIGKMTGDCVFFGRKMKRAGLYAMLAQIVLFVVCTIQIIMELALFSEFGAPKGYLGYYVPQWYGATGKLSQFYSNYYEIGDLVIMIAELAHNVLLFVLLISLYRQYNPKMHMMFAMLSLFIPESRYIITFILRNKKRIDYDAYVRQKQEEFMRRQQQYYNMYGNPNNPYGNPYNRGYGPQGPYGNPFQQNENNPNNPPPKDEPFSEFASNAKKQETTNTNSANSHEDTKKGTDADDFFS